MTDEVEASFKAMNHCHICGNKYTGKDVRVRDHCHVTGKFRGSAHQECNLINNKTNDLTLNLTPENMTQHSRIE